MEKAIFLIVALSIVAIEFVLFNNKPNIIIGAIIFITLVLSVGFYLFQFGELGILSIKALGTDAKFIKQKKKEVIEDSKAIKELMGATQKSKEQIEQILKDLEIAKGEMEKYNSDLVSLKLGIVEIVYLQHMGRNIFPNPYQDRIIAKLNEIFVIAISNPEKRAVFIRELQQYTKSPREKK